MNPSAPPLSSGTPPSSLHASTPPSATPGNLPLALGLGLAAAALGAAVWGAVAYFSNYELGILAWGIGLAVGFAVGQLARFRGIVAQAVAMALALLGIVGGKYAVFCAAVSDAIAEEHGAEAAQSFSWVAPQTVATFFQFLPQSLSIFDALWAVLALSSAWRLTAAAKTEAGA